METKIFKKKKVEIVKKRRKPKKLKCTQTKKFKMSEQCWTLKIQINKIIIIRRPSQI